MLGDFYCIYDNHLNYLFFLFKVRIEGSTHHFPIANWESCQRFEAAKTGLKTQVLAYRLFQMISAFPLAHHYQAVLACGS
jgi:hypothetical protein